MKRLLLAGAAGYALLHWLGRTAGATRAERAVTLPGDELVPAPLILTTHAITVDAAPEHIWPWLVQMGWHRGGWYTARWVDQLFFPANWPSAEEIHPELQDLAVGSFIPDGAPETGCGFDVVALHAGHHLVLHSHTHLPPEWQERFGAWIDWSWVFVLESIDERRTRFVFRTRARVGPAWLACLAWLTIVPADFVMARQMLRGVKERAERSPTRLTRTGRAPRSPR